MMILRFIDWTARWAHIAVQFQWEPRDLWVGVFWHLTRYRGATGWDAKHGEISGEPWNLHVYACLLPMLPLHVFIQRTERPKR